jgi:hypothetical protein
MDKNFEQNYFFSKFCHISTQFIVKWGSFIFISFLQFGQFCTNVLSMDARSFFFG